MKAKINPVDIDAMKDTQSMILSLIASSLPSSPRTISTLVTLPEGRVIYFWLNPKAGVSNESYKEE